MTPPMTDSGKGDGLILCWPNACDGNFSSSLGRKSRAFTVPREQCACYRASVSRGQVLKDAIVMAADRFHDLGEIVKETGKYDNAGFLFASARRLREALKLHDEITNAPPDSGKDTR